MVPDSSTGEAALGTDAASPVPSVDYPDSPAGLQALLTDLKNAIQADNTVAMARLLASLRLPNYESWFANRFKAKVASRLTQEYEPVFGEIGNLGGVLRKYAIGDETEPGEIRVERFSSSADEQATGYQMWALRKMKPVSPIYSARLIANKNNVFHIWSFVHEAGTFRYIGKMKKIIVLPRSDRHKSLDWREFRVLDRPRIDRVKK